MKAFINRYLDRPTRFNEWAVYGLVLVYVLAALPYFAMKGVWR